MLAILSSGVSRKVLELRRGVDAGNCGESLFTLLAAISGNVSLAVSDQRGCDLAIFRVSEE